MKRGVKYLAAIAIITCSAYAYNILKRKASKADDTASRKKISITGSACNIPGHAAIRTDSSGTYLIRGMDAWDKDWIDHRINVVGDLISGSSNQPQEISSALVQLITQNQ
jgi:hypothetical protein